MRGPDGRLRTSLDQLLPCFPRAGLRPASSAAHAPRRAALRLPSRRAPRAAPASALWLASGLRANLPGLGRQVGYLPPPRCPSWARAGRALVGLGPILAAWESPSEARTEDAGDPEPNRCSRPARPSRRPSGQRRTPPATASAGDEPAGDERVTGTGAPDPGPRASHGGLSACRVTICLRTTGRSSSAIPPGWEARSRDSDAGLSGL